MWSVKSINVDDYGISHLSAPCFFVFHVFSRHPHSYFDISKDTACKDPGFQVNLMAAVVRFSFFNIIYIYSRKCLS